MQRLLAESTTPLDIFKIAGKICNLFTYPEIRKFKNINQLFKKGNSSVAELCPINLPFDKKCCVILYLAGENFGHWCALTKRGNDINFLDSYGEVIDDQLESVNNNIPGQDKKYLVKLLNKFRGDVYFNDIQMQKMTQNIATCGRYAGLFLKYDYLPVDKFVDTLMKLAKKNNMTCDELVVVVTAPQTDSMIK